MPQRAVRLPLSTTDGLQLLNFLVQLFLLWFCVVLIAPRVLVTARQQDLPLPPLATGSIRTAAWLVETAWLPAAVLVAGGAWLLLRTPSELRPARARAGFAGLSTAVTLLAAATVVATFVATAATWSR